MSQRFSIAVLGGCGARAPSVATEHVYVDAMELFLVPRPDSFDVMVTENMFGDIPEWSS